MTHELTHVTNPITNAVTTFDAFAFESLFEFDGTYYGVSAAGLFKLDDVLSTEQPIGTMRLALLHFGTELQKRIAETFIAMRSKGDITITVEADEQPVGAYNLSPHGIEMLKQRRTLVGKGAKGKYWDFTLECSDDFDYDTINIAAVPVSRRL